VGDRAQVPQLQQLRSPALGLHSPPALAPPPTRPLAPQQGKQKRNGLTSQLRLRAGQGTQEPRLGPSLHWEVPGEQGGPPLKGGSYNPGDGGRLQCASEGGSSAFLFILSHLVSASHFHYGIWPEESILSVNRRKVGGVRTLCSLAGDD